MSRAPHKQAMLFCLTLGWLPVLATSETLSEGMRRCAGNVDQAQRLACFDALAGTVPKVEADQFGMTAEIAHKRTPAAPPPTSEVLAGKIASLRQAAHGEYIFTLDNDQVWMQAEPNPRMQFEVGEAVHIEHGAMSSLWLVADHHRKTRVKRIS